MQKLSLELLQSIGIQPKNEVKHQLSRAELIEYAAQSNEGSLADNGSLNIFTGKFTGRSPKDRFIVIDELTAQSVDWNEINQSMEGEVFQRLKDRVIQYHNSLTRLYTRNVKVGSYEKYSLDCAFVSEKAVQDLFISNMFLSSEEGDLINGWVVLVASELKINDYEDFGINAENCVVLNFQEKTVLVIGTAYTGEIKKSMFSVMNFILPHKHDVLSMHCSANVGISGDTALFFGLSGTGKTTLSTDKGRLLIGDDEHGWAKEGVFNFEGGCYAKCIGLSAENEPDIFNAIRFGALTENLVFKKGCRIADYDDKSITENIRVSYPLSFIPLTVDETVSNSPKNVFFLTADAFGVLPPISKLTIEQAMFYFINGYTAKVAGTEVGILHPVATFSACFGKAFLPLHPMKYADMLKNRLESDPEVKVWLVNTGWIGGPYGVGRRISLKYTRSLLRAALSNEFNDTLFVEDSIFGLSTPTSCPGVPDEILNPKALWQNDEVYDLKAAELKDLFEENYQKYSINIGSI